MQRRCLDHDYASRMIYMVTMTTEGRSPLFGEVVGRSDAPDDSPDAPHILLTSLGQRVCDEWWGIPRYYPEVEIIALQMMPDHIHGVIFVRKRMQKDLSRIIRGFKTGCNRAYRQLVQPVPSVQSVATQSQHTGQQHTGPEDRTHGLLFARGYNDKLLLRQGQLECWLQYLKDNPRRLLLKREHPDLFRLHRQTEVCGLQFTSMGNHFLLDWPFRQQVEMSRSASEEQIAERLKTVLAAARRGAVTYTAAISNGEKIIARTVREQGFPLVVLLNEGFPEKGSPWERYYKPGGVYFNACSLGRLLLMEPDASAFLASSVIDATENTLRRKAEAKHLPYTALPTTSLRYRFLALNTIAHLLTTR